MSLFAKFDPSLSYLALAVQALDAHQVRVQALVPTHDLLNTLFAVGKDKLSTFEWLLPTQLALGFANGAIRIYEPAANAVVAELAAASVAIADIHFSAVTRTVWAADVNGTLYEWDTALYTLLQKLSLADMVDAEPVSKLALVLWNDEPHLLVGTHNVYLVDVLGKKIAKTFPAHVQPINAIVAVPGSPDLFVTAAAGDRFANIYSIAKGSTRAVLVAESAIRAVALGVSGPRSILAALTENGVLETFDDPLVFDAPVVAKKKRRQLAAVQSKHAAATVRYLRPANEIRNPDDALLHLDAVAASDTTVHVTWTENGSQARFDAVPWHTDAGFAWAGSVTVAKARVEARAAENAKHGHDVAAPRLYAEHHAVVTEGSAFQRDVDDDDDETLAERLEKIGGDGRKLGGRRKLAKHTAGTLTVVLSQALRNNDHTLLETVLGNRDPKVVQRTIARMELSLAVVLVDRLTERITRQQLRFDQLNFWLKWIVIIHGGVLTSMPNMGHQLASLHAVLTKKANTLPRLLELQGRLNMLQQQNTLKKEILSGAGGDLDAETDVEYVEEVDDAVEAGIMDSDDDDDIGIDGMDSMDDLGMDGADDYEDGEASEGLSDVETAVAHDDVFE